MCVLCDIRFILYTRKEPVSAGAIGIELGIEQDATHSAVRRLILELMERDRVAIGANAKGYYVIRSEAQLNEYIGNLTSRIVGIEERRDLVHNCWYERNAEK